MPRSRTPSPRPGSCRNNESIISESSLNFLKHHTLLDDSVGGITSLPLYVKASMSERLTVIAVEPSQHFSDIFYVGTSNGRVHKLVWRKARARSWSKLWTFLQMILQCETWWLLRMTSTISSTMTTLSSCPIRKSSPYLSFDVIRTKLDCARNVSLCKILTVLGTSKLKSVFRTKWQNSDKNFCRMLRLESIQIVQSFLRRQPQQQQQQQQQPLPPQQPPQLPQLLLQPQQLHLRVKQQL